MRDLQARSLKKACFIAALFSMMLSAAPAFAQTVTAMWDPSPSTDQVTGYQVCIGTSSVSSSLPCNVGLIPVGASTTGYAFAPTAGVRYYLAIRANNAAGSSPFSSEVSFSIPSFTQPGNQASIAGLSISPLALSINDPDGSALTITHTGLPPGLSINSATRQITGIPTAAGTYNATVWVNDGLATVSRSLTWTVRADAAVDSVLRLPGYFDDDRFADAWRYELSDLQGMWRVRFTGSGTYANYAWGVGGDFPVPADYDGDGRTDFAVYRPSTGQWFILRSSTNYSYSASWAIQWGLSGDLPVPADFDGDGRADVTIYRPSTGQWFILRSSSNYSYAGYTVYGWGATGDIPLPADYDGDRRADLTVYRPSSGQWFILKSSANYSYAGSSIIQWGLNGDVPVPADYDGDGRADLTVLRPSSGQWFILKSRTNYAYSGSWVFPWGTGGDVPRQSDYDGDGSTDLAIWRASENRWYILKSSTNFTGWVAYQSQ